MKTILLLCLLVSACAAGEAAQVFESLTTRNGRTFKQVKVVRFSGSRLHFTHAEGAAAVQVDLLPVEVQNALGFTPDTAYADMKRIQEERLQAVIDEASRRRQRVEEQAELKAKREAMRLIEQQGVQMRLDVDEVLPQGCFCRAWRIVPVEIPGKRALSGAPMTKPGITQQVPCRVFVHGLEAAAGQALMRIIYPINGKESGPRGARPYAIETETAWLESRKARAGGDDPAR